jgi:hypothetical protein
MQLAPNPMQVSPSIWNRALARCTFTSSIKTKNKNIMKKVILTCSNFAASQLHLLLIIISSFFSQHAAAQDSSYTNYLKNNHEKITIGSNKSLAIFDDAFYSNQIFLVSESHGYMKPHQLDLELFKMINRKTGLRYYLAEIDFSQAYYLNKYLNTGKEEFLKNMYQQWYNQQAQWGNKTGFEKWRSIYAYNKTLPKNKKIIVLGLDNVQDLNLNEKRITEILAEVKYKNSSNVMLDSLLGFANKDVENDTTKSFKKFVKRLSIDVSMNEATYKTILKNKYFDFQIIIDNIASKKGREAKIFENFNSFYTEYKLSNEKMYGFWGRFHAMQDSISSAMPFAGMLKKSGLPFTNQIVSIPVFCVESASMLPTAFLPPMAQQKGTIFSKSTMVNDDSFIYTVEGIKTFRNFVGKDESVIFKLNAPASPFNRGLNLVETSSQFDKTFNWAGNKKAATTSYFQYAIVVSNSDWAVPYGDNTAK